MDWRICPIHEHPDGNTITVTQNISVARKCFPAKCHWHGSQRDPRHFFPLPDEVRRCQTQEFAHHAVLSVGKTIFQGMDVGSIHGAIKVATPMRYGLEDLSCLFSAFSGFDLAGRVRRTLFGASTVRLPPARGGNINTGHILPKGYESLLTEGDASILTKGYESILTNDCESILEMVIRQALQAAGYICSPWRTQVRDHGFDRVLFLCRRRERLFQVPYDTKLNPTWKPTRRRPTCFATETSSLSPRAFPFCSSRTVPTYEGNTLHLAVLRWDGREVAENLMEIFTDRMYPPQRGSVRSKNGDGHGDRVDWLIYLVFPPCVFTVVNFSFMPTRLLLRTDTLELFLETRITVIENGETC